VFDQFATDAGCENALGSAAVFDCLRELPIAAIQNATDRSPSVFGYSVRSVLCALRGTRRRRV
jgi:acetylcholinesterase